MGTDQTGRPPLERVPTGVPGLDTILRGGVLRGGLFIIQGSPGAGKTILGNQICFRHVANGGRALYVTLLAENHARMLLHIGQLGFFEETVIPDRLYYISAFRVLEGDGLAGLLDLLRREVQSHDASVLIIDGLSAVEDTAASTREFKKFIHQLQAQAAVANCTMFLLTGAKPVSAEHTLVDGVIDLQTRLHGRRAERSLQVHKLRGSATCEASIRSASPAMGSSSIPASKHCSPIPRPWIGEPGGLFGPGLPGSGRLKGEG